MCARVGWEWMIVVVVVVVCRKATSTSNWSLYFYFKLVFSSFSYCHHLRLHILLLFAVIVWINMFLVAVYTHIYECVRARLCVFVRGIPRLEIFTFTFMLSPSSQMVGEIFFVNKRSVPTIRVVHLSYGISFPLLFPFLIVFPMLFVSIRIKSSTEFAFCTFHIWFIGFILFP